MAAVALYVGGRRSRRLPVAALAILAFLAVVTVGGGILLTSLRRPGGGLDGVSCPVPAGQSDQALHLNAAQLRNAQTIISTGRDMRVSTRGQVVAIAVALDESTLRNLANSNVPSTMADPRHEGAGHDHDSVGLFQQRPSQGWGNPTQLLDPVYSSTQFYTHLQNVMGWQQMSINEAAQTVQRSGTPYAYAKFEQQAVNVVAKLGPGLAAGAGPVSSAGCTAPEAIASGPVGTMVQVALAQVGKPYVWGATGPDAFDCSGLVVYAWRRAGYTLHVRTSQQMYGVATPVKPGEERSGDLIFSEFGEQGPGPGHVMIVVRPGTLVQAPRTGSPVRVQAYDPHHRGWTFGRLPASAMTQTR